MRGLSAILTPAARFPVRDGVGGLVLHVNAALIAIVNAICRLAFLSPRGTLRRKRPNVQALTEQVNALEVRQALDQPPDPIVHGEPGFVGRRMAVAAAPAPDGFFETWGKAAFSAVLAGAAISPGGIWLGFRDVVRGGCGILLCQLWRL
jgi:hypothetical protein